MQSYQTNRKMNNNSNWILILLILSALLLIIFGCNSVKKSSGQSITETRSVIVYDTTRVKIIDTSKSLQEWIEFQTKTIELFDTTYTDVPILRKRIIYENVKASSNQIVNGYTKDSLKSSGAGNTISISATDYKQKNSFRVPFWLFLFVPIIIILIVGGYLKFREWQGK